MLFPRDKCSQLNIKAGEIKERHAPQIIEMLASHGIDVPVALGLDDESVYNCADLHGETRMSPQEASAFWNAGFIDIDEQNSNGLTPLRQNFFCANFEMVAWFVEKGVALSLRHRDAPLTALHLYAKRLSYPEEFFFHDVDAVLTDKHYMAQLHQQLGIPYDDCTCACSLNGCSPVKFVSNINVRGGQRRHKFRKWLQNVALSESLLSQYVQEFTRKLLFEFLGGDHTCCDLDQLCGIKARRTWISSILPGANEMQQRNRDGSWSTSEEK